MNIKLKEYYKFNIYSILVLIIVLALLFGKLYEISFILLGLYLVYINYEFILTIKEKEYYKLQFENLSKNIDNSIQNNMFNLIYPICILDTNGDIVWHNNNFKELSNSKDIIGNSLVSVIRGIALDKILKVSKEYSQRIKIKNFIYEIYGEILVQSKERSLYIVYFNDVTYSSNETKESVMLLEVDNLNEVIKSIDDSKRPLLMAEIERTINHYGSTLGAMIKKYDINKYILSISDSVIDKEISGKFDILDTVRDIDLGNELEVTLSIGVGRGGETPAENHEYATKAKELALGRGGDQTVIKTGKEIFFFGGNAKELEKRTRVKARVIAHALKNLIYESSKVYIMGHKNPDMDCLGAALGIASVVKKLGKVSKVVLDNDISAIEIFLSKIKVMDEYNNLFISSSDAEENIGDNTLLIVVDVHSLGYVLDKDLVEASKRIVVIDHHRRSPDFIQGALLNYIEVYASSTSEMVTEMVQYMLDKPKLNRTIAEGLLAGICMDTKNFSFKTGVRTFEAASFLRKLGADTIEIKKIFSDDLESFITRAEIIKSARVDNSVAIAICPEYVVKPVVAAQAADELLNITGIQASFVLVKINNNVYISGRSLGDMNVQVILESLGGGGHMTMAGSKLKNTSIEDAINMLKQAISKNLREGE